MPKHIPIWAARRFIKTWRNLSASQKQKIGEILIALPDLQVGISEAEIPVLIERLRNLQRSPRPLSFAE
jgi:hypothetical protein